MYAGELPDNYIGCAFYHTFMYIIVVYASDAYTICSVKCGSTACAAPSLSVNTTRQQHHCSSFTLCITSIGVKYVPSRTKTHPVNITRNLE